jgi:hypothetical protein
MSYDELKTKLYENLKQLMIQCDNWEVGLYEVINYRDYMTKILTQYKQQHEAN